MRTYTVSAASIDSSGSSMDDDQQTGSVSSACPLDEITALLSVGSLWQSRHKLNLEKHVYVVVSVSQRPTQLSAFDLSLYDLVDDELFISKKWSLDLWLKQMEKTC